MRARCFPPGAAPPSPRDYGEEEDLTPHEKEKTVRMEVSMPTFLLGFKCAPVGDGPEQMRQNLIGELACDVLMGESSRSMPGSTAKDSSTAASATASIFCPARPMFTPGATATTPAL